MRPPDRPERFERERVAGVAAVAHELAIDDLLHRAMAFAAGGRRDRSTFFGRADIANLLGCDQSL
jgi:hypothetical protein